MSEGGLMEQINNFECKYCGCTKALKKENDLMVYAECMNCHEPTMIKAKINVEQKTTKPDIECPYCHSTDIKNTHWNMH